MSRASTRGLNDSGEEGTTRLFGGGALHWSRTQRTSRHAHYAWKIHVGLDAPVWAHASGRRIDGAPVLVVPPNVEHATGAVGWSVAVFVAPGSRGTSLRGASEPRVVTGTQARRIADLCRAFDLESRAATPDFADALAIEAFDEPGRPVDRRVARALQSLRLQPQLDTKRLAASLGLSLDRLSRLISRQTGLPLRRHVVWSRLIRGLSTTRRHTSLAAAAVEAGFSDHAHMTRTYRAYLGRAPSEFSAPPDVLAPW